MKIRQGFVSNSSSSSFIISKRNLKKEDEQKIISFLDKRNNFFETSIEGNSDNYIWGYVEAHNSVEFDGGEYDSDPANIMLEDLLLSDIRHKSFIIKYEDYVQASDIPGEENTVEEKEWKESVKNTSWLDDDIIH